MLHKNCVSTNAILRPHTLGFTSKGKASTLFLAKLLVLKLLANRQ
jgi:hypothetical protein